jgi:hypothetical protein
LKWRSPLRRGDAHGDRTRLDVDAIRLLLFAVAAVELVQDFTTDLIWDTMGATGSAISLTLSSLGGHSLKRRPARRSPTSGSEAF